MVWYMVYGIWYMIYGIYQLLTDFFCQNFIGEQKQLLAIVSLRRDICIVTSSSRTR
jgi:hypothetical protein